MMTFSGSGSYRAGGSGSLSSSSLSPLAPPFKVDKSIPKLNSVNPSVYADVPMYGPYFESTGGQFWNPSSAAAGQKFVAPESMGVDVSSSSSNGIYGYPGSQPSITATGPYRVSSGATDAYDPFPYDPFSNRMSTTAEEGEKVSFSPYVPSAPLRDGYLSLGVGSGHGYDLLSSSSSAHLSGCGSSQADHPQARAGDGRSKVNWGSIWGAVDENEQDKWSGYAQGFGSKNLSQPDSPSNKFSYVFDGTNKNPSFTDVNTHPFTDGSCFQYPGDVGNRSHLKQDGNFDIFGGTYHLGSLAINRHDSMSVLDFSRMPTSVSGSISKESSCIQEPVLEPVAEVSGSKKANASSPGDHFSQSGFYVFGCSSTTSTNPATMTKPPYGDSSLFAENALSALKPNSSSVVANKSSGSAGYDSSCPIEPQMSVGLKPQSSVVIRRPVSSVMSSSRTGELADYQFKSNDSSVKTHVSPSQSHQFSSNGFNLGFNDAQATFSVEKFSGETDAHNPAEDSPCWRGASKRFSPFELSEGSAPDAPVKNLADCKSPSSQEPEIKSLLVDTSDSHDSIFKKISQSQDIEENLSSIRNPIRLDLNAEGGLQFGYDTCLSTKECCISDKPKTVSVPGLTLDAHPLYAVENSCSISKSYSTASAGTVRCPPVVTENSSGLASGIKNKCSNSPNSNGKHCESSELTDASVDVNVLLKTMAKLSEILRCYCFGIGAGVPEQHSFAIKHIIANLNASLSMMVGGTAPAVVSSQGISSLKEFSVAHMVNDVEAVTAAAKLAGIAEGFLDSISVKEGTIADADMAEASKKFLHVNLRDDVAEETQQNLLYKSLWLEAEASLCAMTAKARFLRMKAEMEKAPGVAKGELISDVQGVVGLATLDKDSSVHRECQKPNADSQIHHAEVPEANKSQTSNIQVDPNACKVTSSGISGSVLDGSGTSSHTVNVEASVMSRYQILKDRIENSECPCHDSEQPSGGYNDSSSFFPPAVDPHGTETISQINRAEIPVLARYQILKRRIDHDSENDERSQSPGVDNYLPDRDSSSPRYQILESGVENSDSLYEGRVSSAADELSQNSQSQSSTVSVPEEDEASVMARFRLIQNRHLLVNKDQSLGHTNREVIENEGDHDVGLPKPQSNVLRYTFGPYPDLAEDKDAEQVSFCVDNGAFLTQHIKTNRLSTEIFESWYDNDCSSSDWEHVSKDDVRRQN